MKRGFEENVPKLRPRVRLGRALAELDGQGSDEAPSAGPQLAHSDAPRHGDSTPAYEQDEPSVELRGAPGAATTAAAPSPTAPMLTPAPASTNASAASSRIEMQDAQMRSAIAREHEESARHQRLREVRARGEEAGHSMAPASTPGELLEEHPDSRGPSRKGTAAAKVAQLARELSAELELAAEANSRLKVDLDGALSALRRAAEESRERTDERDRMSAEVEKRAAAARELLGELEMLEAERDGALAQTARFSRELRESRSMQAELQETANQARHEAEQARGQLQRLAGELEARVAERDAARAELSRVRSEKESLAEALLAARAEADEAMESRSALEEIERALGAARTRVAGIR
jgi:DNA repair exonuclease SbcCD ATPase subunit